MKNKIIELLSKEKNIKYYKNTEIFLVDNNIFYYKVNVDIKNYNPFCIFMKNLCVIANRKYGGKYGKYGDICFLKDLLKEWSMSNRDDKIFSKIYSRMYQVYCIVYDE